MRTHYPGHDRGIFYVENGRHSAPHAPHSTRDSDFQFHVVHLAAPTALVGTSPTTNHAARSFSSVINPPRARRESTGDGRIFTYLLVGTTVVLPPTPRRALFLFGCKPSVGASLKPYGTVEIFTYLLSPTVCHVCHLTPDRAILT